MTDLEQLKQDERLAYIEGDVAKATLLAALIDAIEASERKYFDEDDCDS